MKGVSSIVMVILLVMITVALAVSLYAFLSRTQSELLTGVDQQQEQQGRVSGSELKIVSTNETFIILRNIGRYDVTNFTVYVDDLPVSVNAPSKLGPGEIGNITILSGLSIGDHRLKITGVYAQVEGYFSTQYDTSPPQYSNVQAQLITAYTSIGYSNFSVTWSDTNFSSAYLESNFTGSLENISMSGSYPNFYYNTVSLPAQSYQYRFVANDTLGNNNANAINYFTISKAPTSISLFLNKTDDNYNYIQNGYANFTAVSNASGLTVNISTNITGWTEPTGITKIENITRLNSVGIFNITGYTLGNANYTGSSATHYANTTVQPCVSFGDNTFNNINSDTKLCSQLHNNVTFNLTQGNILFDCNGATLNGTGTGIAINSTFTSYRNNTTIENCNIQNYTSGISMRYMNNSFILNTTSYRIDYSIIVSDSANMSIDCNNNFINGAGKAGYGIYFYSSVYLNIENCKILGYNGNSASRGIYFNLGHHNKIFNTISNSSTTGIYIFGSNFYNLTNNIACANSAVNLGCTTGLTGTGSNNTVTSLGGCQALPPALPC